MIKRIHCAISEDGTNIVASVYGQGPALVLLPPGPAECEQGWHYLWPFVAERFTCYLMNTRGRGLSADHPDHSPARLVEDVLALVNSIGEPVVVVEWGSGLWAYAAAKNHPAISAVAVYEPGVDEVMPEAQADQLEEIFTEVWEIGFDGRLEEAASFFIEHSHIIYSDADLATGIPNEFWQAAAPNLPIFLKEQAEMVEYGAGSPNDPSILSKITVPILLLRGTETTRWFFDSADYVADYVKYPQIQEIDHAGHFGPCLHPEAIARALEGFLS